MQSSLPSTIFIEVLHLEQILLITACFLKQVAGRRQKDETTFTAPLYPEKLLLGSESGKVSASLNRLCGFWNCGTQGDTATLENQTQHDTTFSCCRVQYMEWKETASRWITQSSNCQCPNKKSIKPLILQVCAKRGDTDEGDNSQAACVRPAGSV